jgi:hypothetical protein
MTNPMEKIQDGSDAPSSSSSSFLLLRVDNVARHSWGRLLREERLLASLPLPLLRPSKAHHLLQPRWLERHIVTGNALPSPPAAASDGNTFVIYGKDPAEAAAFLAGILRRMQMPLLTKGWATWAAFIRFAKLRSIMLKMMHSNLGLAWLRWAAAALEARRRQRVVRVLQHLLHRQQALAWRKWREVSDEVGLRERRRRALQKWQTWRFAPAWRQWLQVVTVARGPGRPRLSHCDCVYRVLRGRHCRCSAEKHFGNRLQALRWSLDQSLEVVAMAPTSEVGGRGGGGGGGKENDEEMMKERELVMHDAIPILRSREEKEEQEKEGFGVVKEGLQRRRGGGGENTRRRREGKENPPITAADMAIAAAAAARRSGNFNGRSARGGRYRHRHHHSTQPGFSTSLQGSWRGARW